MSSLPTSLSSFGEIMTCQGELLRETDDKTSDTHTSCRNEQRTDEFDQSLKNDPGNSFALHTLVDMALALEEKASRGTDHTYALKNQIRRLPTEDTDNVSKEKDHTYASNTIGLRYSNHRGNNAQPRKSASEESLVIKPSSVSSARKCTSAEKFENLGYPGQSVANDDHLYSFESTAATLPRVKNKTFQRPCISSEELFAVPSNIDETSAVPVARDENQIHAGMEVQSAPRKTDHTYAKFGMSKFFIPHNALDILSSTAKIEDLQIDLAATSGFSDHTYDKFSSPKLKDLHDKFSSYKSFVLSSGSAEIAQEVEIDIPVVSLSQHAGGSDMEWQHGQIIEKRFLPNDHTYTTVA